MVYEPTSIGVLFWTTRPTLWLLASTLDIYLVLRVASPKTPRIRSMASDTQFTGIDADYNPVTDKMLIGEKKSDSIVLPPSIFEDKSIKPFQITQMKATVYSVRNNSKIAGELVRATAFSLWDLKQNLVGKQWISFLKSGALPIPEKQARDLANAWEVWMSDMEVTDGDLVGLGTRTLAKMNKLSPSMRKKVLKKKKEGEKITEAYITNLLAEAKNYYREGNRRDGGEGCSQFNERTSEVKYFISV